MPVTIQILLEDYQKELRKIYGLHLKSVILYGSYARGDFTQESDVDIMILVDLTEEEMDQYSDELAEVGFDYNVAHGIWMMPVVKIKIISDGGQKHILFMKMFKRRG